MKNFFYTLCLLVLVFSSCQETASIENENTPSNVEIIQGMYDNFALGQVDPVLAAMHDSIIWNEAENFPLADGNPYIGPQAVLGGVFGRLANDWDNFRLEVDRIQPVGDDGALATGRYKGSNKASGKELDAQFAHIWSIKEGKVTQFQQYTDTKQVADVSMVEAEESD